MADILDLISEAQAFNEEREKKKLQEATPKKVRESDEMSEAMARQITEAIKGSSTATYILLARAHKHKAYKVLGYSSFRAYCETELEISAQHGYNLLNLDKVIKEIETVIPEGSVVKLTEFQAREIKNMLPQITEKIKHEIEGKQPDEVRDIVNSIVEEARTQKKNEDKAKEEWHSTLEDAADEILKEDRPKRKKDKDDFSLDDDELEELKSSLKLDESPKRNDESPDLAKAPDGPANPVGKFIQVLKSIEELAEPEVIIPKIHESKAADVEDKVLESIAWLENFYEVWVNRDRKNDYY